MLLKTGSNKYGIYSAFGEQFEFDSFTLEGTIERKIGTRVFSPPIFLPADVPADTIPEDFFGSGKTYVVNQTPNETLGCPAPYTNTQWTIAFLYERVGHLLPVEPPFPYYIGLKKGEMLYVPKGSVINSPPYPLSDMVTVIEVGDVMIKVLEISTGKTKSIAVTPTEFYGLHLTPSAYKVRIQEALEIVEAYIPEDWISLSNQHTDKQLLERCNRAIVQFSETLQWARR